MSNPVKNSVTQFENAAECLDGTQQVALGPRIRMLVWNAYKASHKNWLEDFEQLNNRTDLVLVQNAATTATGIPFNDNEGLHSWLMTRSDMQFQRDSMSTAVTGCIADAQKHREHHSNPNASEWNTRRLLLETHYAIELSEKTLMVLHVSGTGETTLDTDTDTDTDQLDELCLAIESHNGPAILCGDFTSWSAEGFESFRQYAATASLFEASTGRPRSVKTQRQQFDQLFFRGLSLHSFEAMPNIQSSEFSPISATLVVE